MIKIIYPNIVIETITDKVTIKYHNYERFRNIYENVYV